MSVVLAFIALDGPVALLALLAPPCAKRGVKVPFPQPLTTTVRVADDVSDPGENEHPVAEPAFEKSADVTPVTASENVSE